MNAIMDDATFGYSNSVEGAKPLIWFIVSLLTIAVFTSIAAGAAVTIFAAAMQAGAQGNKQKAKDTLLFGSIPVIFAFGFYILGAIAVYSPKIAAAISAFQAA